MTLTKITCDNASECECHRWITEASTIGLRPGQWPEQLATMLGNGLPFHAIRALRSDSGDLVAIEYAQANGCLMLKVVND